MDESHHSSIILMSPLRTGATPLIYPPYIHCCSLYVYITSAGDVTFSTAPYRWPQTSLPCLTSRWLHFSKRLASPTIKNKKALVHCIVVVHPTSILTSDIFRLATTLQSYLIPCLHDLAASDCPQLITIPPCLGTADGKQILLAYSSERPLSLSVPRLLQADGDLWATHLHEFAAVVRWNRPSYPVAFFLILSSQWLESR
jgi:hypothetical protein